MSRKGVYSTKLKNGKPSFRASLTAGGRHISLGSYRSEAAAHKAYLQAGKILADKKRYPLDNLEAIAGSGALPFGKIVVLMNLRDNGLYMAAPIYIFRQFFYYFLSPSEHLVFDREDLFYYASKTIMRRGGHLFVADYGMQVSILSRYGVRPFAVKGRDYRFVNGDENDLRGGNIEIINPYFGVRRIGSFGQYKYKTVLHLRSNYVIGTYDDEITAAIAYNKAVDLIKGCGVQKDYPVNYIDTVPASEYAAIYAGLPIAKRFLSHLKTLEKAPGQPDL